MAIKICLDELLRERGMTSKELCAKIGITEANLSILRSGKAKGVRFGRRSKDRGENYEDVLAAWRRGEICYYLNCDVGDILKFDGELEGGDEN